MRGHTCRHLSAAARSGIEPAGQLPKRRQARCWAWWVRWLTALASDVELVVLVLRKLLEKLEQRAVVGLRSGLVVPPAGRLVAVAVADVSRRL